MNTDKKNPAEHFFRLCLSVLIGGYFFSPAVAHAAVALPTIFSDGMVLQRDVPVAVWGTATAGTAVRVTLGEQAADATVDADGRWKATLPPLAADASPRELAVTGDASIAVVRDVLVGDVWFCAGQSNMGYTLAKATGGPEAVAAADDPLLRSFDVAVEGSPTPLTDVRGQWKAATPAAAGGFSAVAYFFARELRREVGVPVGIVHASVGGSPIEAWSRRGSLDGVGFMKNVLRQSDAKLAKATMGQRAGTQAGSQPATQPFSDLTRKTTPGWLYNGAVAPLVGVGVRGFVWYQGESNVDNAEQYRTLFPRLIQDWRKQWGVDGQATTVPFLFVQLAARDTDQDEPFGSPTADLRMAQAVALDQKLTGMAVAIDTRAADWHPADKLPVAKRLANLALKLAHGRDKAETIGPIWIGRRFDDDGTAMIRFHSVGGLKAPNDQPSGFTIAGADRRFYPADAKIIGKDRDAVELSSPDVDQPVAVRYGWSRGPTCDLTNAAGLPTAPFRTDDWPTPTTKPAK